MNTRKQSATRETREFHEKPNLNLSVAKADLRDEAISAAGLMYNKV